MKKTTIKKQTLDEPKPNLAISDDNFKIYLRTKPGHVDSNNQILRIINNKKVEICSPYYTVSDAEKVYSYEEVFDTQVNNHQVFNSTMITPISNALNGYNSTIFIYGMTGAGKTYTMFGSLSSGGSSNHKSSEEGLVSMTVDYLFREIKNQPEIHSQIEVSFYEIYNENIRDLLQEDNQHLNIMEDPVRGVFINGLIEVKAEDENQIKNVILSGIERRAMNSTKLNEVSSRSHAILQFTIKRYITSGPNEASVLESKFFMIDLAGNEKTSNNESRRFIEGVNINKSLLTLGKCLSILAEKKGAYVPFRDSKLTRILKESLGGNSKTAMIACVSSEKRFYEETLNTLKYSSIAKKIKNKGVKHNMKIISRLQIPDSKNFVNIRNENNLPKESESKIKDILAQFINYVEVKVKIEKVQEDLEVSLKENEELMQQDDHDSETCRNNINKIGDTLKELMRPYEKNMLKINNSYGELMKTVQIIVEQKNNSMLEEISSLKQIISHQNYKIKEFEAKLEQSGQHKHGDSYHEETYSETVPMESTNKLKSLNSPSTNKENTPLLGLSHQYSQNRSQSKRKNEKLSINCGDSDETPRSLTLQSFNYSNLECSRVDEVRKNKFQKEIVINLNSSKGEDSQSSGRELFVKKLKETEKRVKGIESAEISLLLQEQETNKYELGNAEMSMIRKLRFFQREKSLEKSLSLNRNNSKNQSLSKSFSKRY